MTEIPRDELASYLRLLESPPACSGPCRQGRAQCLTPELCHESEHVRAWQGFLCGALFGSCFWGVAFMIWRALA